MRERIVGSGRLGSEDVEVRGADAAVVFDGWMKRWGHPEICTATRGVLAADVELRTGDRDLHSGHYGGTALNAIHALAQTLVAVFPREDGRLPKPLCEGVVRPDADELESWTRLSPGDEELRRVGARPLDPRAADEFYVRAWAEPSLDVTAILGGKPGLRNTTLVSRASALVTVRLVPDQDVATVGAALERLLREAAPDGTELDIRWEGTPPGILPADERVQGAALEALERAFGRRPLLVRSGGTLPIVPALAAAGIPSILAGMATPDCNTHSPNERMPLEAFDVGVRAARELYLALGELR